MKKEIRIKLVENLVHEMERQLAEVRNFCRKNEECLHILLGAEAYIITTRRFGDALDLANECYQEFRRVRSYALEVWHKNR